MKNGDLIIFDPLGKLKKVANEIKKQQKEAEDGHQH